MKASYKQFWLVGQHCHVMGAHFVEAYIAAHTDHPLEVRQEAGYNSLYQSADFIVEKMIEMTNQSI